MHVTCVMPCFNIKTGFFYNTGISYFDPQLLCKFFSLSKASGKIFLKDRFLPEASFGLKGIVIACVCLWVCSCVCVSLCQSLACPRDNSGPVQARIANLDQRCKRPWSLLFWGAIDLDLLSQIKLKSQNLLHFELVRTITHYPLKLGSPNLDQRWKITFG